MTRSRSSPTVATPLLGDGVRQRTRTPTTTTNGFGLAMIGLLMLSLMLLLQSSNVCTVMAQGDPSLCGIGCQICDATTTMCTSCALGFLNWNGTCLLSCPPATVANNVSRTCDGISHLTLLPYLLAILL
jgi:hypothetical protein